MFLRLIRRCPAGESDPGPRPFFARSTGCRVGSIKYELHARMYPRDRLGSRRAVVTLVAVRCVALGAVGALIMRSRADPNLDEYRF